MRNLLLPALAAISLVLGCSPEERSFASGGEGGSAGSGGSGGEGGSGGSALSADEACAQYAAALCSVESKCAPHLISIRFGDEAACTERYRILCGSFLAAPETSWDPSKMAACASAYASLACPDYIASYTQSIPECEPGPGSRPYGSPCYDDSQCATGYCQKGFAPCGSCGNRVGAGEACTVFGDDCKPGLACLNGVCVVERALGEPCAADTGPCAFPLVCRASVCEEPWMKPGMACSPNVPGDCNGLTGLYCNSQTSACQPVLLSEPGMQCGDFGEEKYDCGAAGVCDPNNTCVGPSPDGGPCDGMVGPGCTLPAFCVGNACSLPAPDKCG